MAYALKASSCDPLNEKTDLKPATQFTIYREV